MLDIVELGSSPEQSIQILEFGDQFCEILESFYVGWENLVGYCVFFGDYFYWHVLLCLGFYVLLLLFLGLWGFWGFFLGLVFFGVLERF